MSTVKNNCYLRLVNILILFFNVREYCAIVNC